MITAARTTSHVLFHMVVAFVVMWAATGSTAFGGVAALVEPLCYVALPPCTKRPGTTSKAPSPREPVAPARPGR